MTIRIGNAPCSWGVEFADDPRNPPWRACSRNARAAGYTRHRTRPHRLHAGGPGRPRRGAGRARADTDRRRGLPPLPRSREMGRGEGRGRPHLQGAGRPWREAPGADRFDLAPPRAHRRTRRPRPSRWTRPNGRPSATASATSRAWAPRTTASPSRSTPHAAGFIDFEPELERLLDEIDESLLKICLDTGHSLLCGLRSRGLHEAPHRAHFLHALQGHRPRR